ncbi:MAG: A/G-specific adenine glycosylase [Chloroflexota bacterium]
MIDVGALQAAVLGWYAREGRQLPFRGTTDPYLVLVSEAILQQTQVSRGGPAWQAFVTRFPTVQALATATPADVLRAWQGLGYNRRAINLQRAARIVVEELGGRFPGLVAELERLPGVGPYTARAVASIAYGEPVGAVDTNVRRVIGRVVAGDASALAPGDLQAIADRLASVDRPADWTHALMDLGATVCRPRDPRCAACPVRSQCHFACAAARSAGASPGAPVSRPAPTPRAIRERAMPFERSTRWLRGRIVDRLREVEGTGWATFDGPLGGHDRTAVLEALRKLAGEGLAELDVGGASAPPGAPSLRARLPLA